MSTYLKVFVAEIKNRMHPLDASGLRRIGFLDALSARRELFLYGKEGTALCGKAPEIVARLTGVVYVDALGGLDFG